MQKRAGIVVSTAVLAVVLSITLVFSSGVQAFADSINNTANAIHLAAGESATIGYSIQATGHNGCDVSAENPVTISLAGVPDGVTVSPETLTFESCDVTQDITFTATEDAQPQQGPYKVTVVVESGTGIGNLSPGNLNVFIKGATQPEVIPDESAPQITYEITGELGNNDWYVSDVTITWTVIDPESTVTSTDGCDEVTVTEDTDGITFTCTATSEGGTSSESVTIKRDATAPEITGSRTPGANTNGWNNEDVTVHFEAADGMSGIASVTPDTVVGEGADQSVTGTATDNAGNSASTEVTDINVDETAPSVTTTRTPEPNTNGWNNEDVTVTFDASDGLSGLDGDASYSETVSTEGADQSVTHTFTDLAGNSFIATEDNINIDKTAPTVSHSLNPSAPNANGWFNQDVVVTFTGSDGLSGIDGSNTQSTTLSNNAAGQSASATFTDLAGNSASDSATGINIDKVKPTITQNFFNVVMHQTVSNYASCFDSLSGIASCLVTAFTVNSGVGSTVTSPAVVATDNADNVESQTLNFNVVGYGCVDGSSGFKSPVPNTQYKLGRDLPLKFTACDLQNNPVSGVVANAQYKLSTATSWTNAVSGSSSTTGNLFRYDPSAGQYIFNMVTNNLQVNKAYNIRAVLDSGQTITVTVTFTK